VIVSASLTAQQAHSIESGGSFVFRRSANGEKWNVISKDLPQYNGTIITILASNPNNAGEFFAINSGIFGFTDLVVLEHYLIFSGLKNILYNILRPSQ
jgi:hypothetical protein